MSGIVIGWWGNLRAIFKTELNTRGSTEVEWVGLVGVNAALPQVLWTRQFLGEQGFRTQIL